MVTALLEESMMLTQRLDDKGTIAHVLRGLGVSAYQQGYLERARQLLRESFAAQEEAQSWPLPPVARADYDSDVAIARAHLGEAAFEAAWVEGQAMTLEQAITYALDDGA